MEEKRTFDTVKDGTESSKVSYIFLCSSESALYIRVSGTKFLINRFLIKAKRVVLKAPSHWTSFCNIVVLRLP